MVGTNQSDLKRSLSVKQRDASCDGPRPVDVGSIPAASSPKPKRGRPSTGFDKLAYNRQFSKDKRAATRLGISVKEFRAAKGEQE